MTDERLRSLEREALAGSKEALDEFVRLRMRQALRPEGHLCWICNAVVSDVDWPKHLASCGIEERRADSPTQFGSSRTVIGGVAVRIVKLPLWSRATLVAGETSTSFFMHGNEGHSNLSLFGPWSSPCLPRDNHFYAFGVALVPDAGSDQAALMQAWNTGSAFFGLGSAPPHEWPARMVMTDPAFLPRLEGGYAVGFDSPRVRLTVRNRPLEILCQEKIEAGFCVPGPLAEALTFMLILYGIRLRPIAS